MPTIPLYETPVDPDAWHRVTAPGGYEWWHFDAHDAEREIRIAIDLFDGDPFNGDYQLAYARYRRRPTRVAPPVPSAYPCVRVAVSEKGKPLWKVDAPQPRGATSGSVEPRRITVGSSSIDWDVDGELRVTLRELSISGTDKTLEAELTFRPHGTRAPRVEQVGRADPTAVHFQVICGDSYEVAGVLREAGRLGPGRAIQFNGPGTYAHSFGTGLAVAKMGKRV